MELNDIEIGDMYLVDFKKNHVEMRVVEKQHVLLQPNSGGLRQNKVYYVCINRLTGRTHTIKNPCRFLKRITIQGIKV